MSETGQNVTNWAMGGSTPAPAPTPTPEPAAPNYTWEQLKNFASMRNNWQAIQDAQAKMQAAAVAPIPWGMDPAAARQMIQFQGTQAMAGIPDQGPSPAFSAGYEELVKNAYPKTE